MTREDVLIDVVREISIINNYPIDQWLDGDILEALSENEMSVSKTLRYIEGLTKAN